MVSYDASVIESFAEALYAQAKSVVIRYSVTFAAVGFVAGFVPMAISSRDMNAAPVVGGLVACVGLLIGISYGRTKAFALRLQAQQALCQVQVEKNTRTAASVRAA